MARGSGQAQQAANTGLAYAGQNQGNANATFGALMPELTAQIAHPTGFNPVEEAKMKTSNMQAAGGSQAGSVGQGALLAGRTKNPGAAAAAIGQSARGAGQQLGQENLATDVANAKLKQQQKAQALGELGSLNATELGGANQALGVVPSAVNANNNAIGASYDWTKALSPISLVGKL